MVVNKISGTIKKGTSSVKSSGPTKILPAPTLITTKNPMIQQQKIFIRQVIINNKNILYYNL
jgi:hypothetical protein